jgi:protein SCO1/2
MEGVGIEEHLGASVPGNLAFTDSRGHPFRLGDRFGKGKPIILVLAYYNCQMLCGLVLSGVARAVKSTGLELGRDYELLTVSFDSRETPALAAERQGHYLQDIGYPGQQASWPFLVGEEPQIHALAESVGFHYKFDKRSNQFAHLAAIYILTPEGKISRYLYGVTYPPRDLKLALLEAGGGRIGSTFEKVLLTCYHYDPANRRYAFFLSWYLKVGGLLVLLGLIALIARLIQWERRAATK